MNETLKNLILVEKYRPQKIDDCILTTNIKKSFKEFVANNKIPNLLLHGGPGVGKTTVAKAMLNELDADYIVINASMNGNIDTLRNEIKDFASSVSLFKEGRKFIILDEADYLNPNSTQPALRNFIEEYHKNCGFILTCNFKNKIIEPLHSRCSVIDFTISKTEKAELKVQFFKRLKYILEQENVTYDANVLVELINKHFPDMRRILNEIERYSISGSIDAGILVNVFDENFDKLIKILKEKNFTEMRKWVSENSDIDLPVLNRKIYEKSHDLLGGISVASIIILMAKYQYQSAFVVDQEINTVAFLTEFMMEAEWL